MGPSLLSVVPSVLGPSLLSAVGAPLCFHSVKGWALGEFNETVLVRAQDVARRKRKDDGTTLLAAPSPSPLPAATVNPTVNRWSQHRGVASFFNPSAFSQSPECALLPRLTLG